MPTTGPRDSDPLPPLRGVRLGLALVWLVAIVLLDLANREHGLSLVP